MRRFFSFWWLCVRSAFWGNTAFANDWQWVFGIPIVSGLLVWGNAKFGAAVMTTGSPIADGFLTALGAFVVTWIIAFAVRFMNAPVILYFGERNRTDELARQLRPQITALYDGTARRCRDEVTYSDGSKGVCFRLQVTNTGIANINGCVGWLTKIEQMPHISPVKLFWIGSPAEKMSEDLTEDVPRYLQICEIRDFNKVIVATEGRLWPVGENNIFRPGEYTFDVVVKADQIKAATCRLKLAWTGNWTTAEMTQVAQTQEPL